MKTIGIIPNESKDKSLEYTNRLLDWLKERSIRVLLPEDGWERLYAESDFVTVLGGDGTMLQAARWCAVCDTPMFGVNLGTLGYLTDVDKDDLFPALQKILVGDCQYEKRMMLQVEGDWESPLLALNEVCVSRGPLMKMIGFSVWINEDFISEYRADGIIVSTPTGSTAYNLSAGGPIIKPDVEIIAITPICAHMLYNRPSVVSGADIVRIKMGNPEISELTLDGQRVDWFAQNDLITIRRAPYYTTIIKTGSLGFYDIIRQKLIER